MLEVGHGSNLWVAKVVGVKGQAYELVYPNNPRKLEPRFVKLLEDLQPLTFWCLQGYTDYDSSDEEEEEKGDDDDDDAAAADDDDGDEMAMGI